MQELEEEVGQIKSNKEEIEKKTKKNEDNINVVYQGMKIN